MLKIYALMSDIPWRISHPTQQRETGSIRPVAAPGTFSDKLASLRRSPPSKIILVQSGGIYMAKMTIDSIALWAEIDFPKIGQVNLKSGLTASALALILSIRFTVSTSVPPVFALRTISKGVLKTHIARSLGANVWT